MKATSEAAFEALIEQRLLDHGGYVSRPPSAYDPALALIADDLLGYVQETQPKTWAKQQAIHGDKLGATLLAAFDKASTQLGVLAVLRHGFKFYGSFVRVATFRPAHGLNPEVAQLYAANRLAVVRQLHFDPKKPGLSLDLTLFLNGIPVVTAELKNAMTNQNAGHARRQYEQDRDPDAPIFRFKRRALVHFAVGSDEVWMTTRLAGTSTYFLPFNRGHGTGAGNRPVEGKHRTSYLWEEVWERHSLLDILARFMHLQVEEHTGHDGKLHRRETMIFPRYHQLDCVRRLLGATRVNGAGTNYLVQHSAGSGKSNSIAWLAHRLASLHDDLDRKVYDGVVVITDRRVLDQQLQNTIYQFDHKQGVVQKIDEDSAQLAAALTEGVPIIISTIHKFGFIAGKIDELPNRRYAVIVDEAHSSQSGDMARDMKAILGASSIAEKFDAQADDVATPDQAALRAALSRGPQPNLSFFAFTATPKFKTLELFGHKGPDGKPAPFHLYSMRQAIEEGFILDVLRGYTTYTRYAEIVKKVSDDPELDRRKGSRALARFISLHPANIAQKTEVIIEHFRACVLPRLGGRAKAMVVTASRLHAVRYKLAFDAYVAERGYTDVGTLVAFSGDVRDPDDPTTKDKPYTEPAMNRHPGTGHALKESELPAAFASDGYNVLIVANKYQTGFDQPLLCAIYVDKRLSGIQAVQTLSRLNRTAWSQGKTETFVLDFVNEREEILASFQDYYEGTTITESIDPQRLYELEGQLDTAHVMHQAEVDQFAAVFFKQAAAQRASDNAALNAALDPAVDRFKALEEEDAERFRGQLTAYCNLYAFLAQIVPFSDADLEKLYAYGKMLLRKLPQRGEDAPPIDINDDVALKYLRLTRNPDDEAALTPLGTQAISGPGETGTAALNDRTETLSTLIELVNARFKTHFDAQDLVDGVVDQLVADEKVQQAAAVNDRANFEFVGGPAFTDALVDRHAKHGEFVDRVFKDAEVLQFLRGRVLDEVYRRLR
jgi:type I restriction enzyme R subunit